MTQERVAIVGGTRTPFARSRSVFQKMTAAALGAVPLRETVQRSGVDPKQIDEIYYGIVAAPADGPNVAREALFDAGLPSSIPCTTVNRYCASALEAAAAIGAKIQAGQIQMGIAGGVESISSIRPQFSQEAADFFQDLQKQKTMGGRLGMLAKFRPIMLAPHAPGIKEPTTGLTMGQAGDLMARLFKVPRQEQDQFALNSHVNAGKGWANGFFNSHVVPVSTPNGKVIDKDPDIRADSSMEKLAKLKPVFYKDGSITAGNASPLTDGASAVLLASDTRAKELGLKTLGWIKSVATAAVDIQTEPLLIGPVYAIPKALKMAGLTWEDIDLYEIHEAFAGQVLATIRAIESPEFARDKLGLSAPIGKVDPAKLNLNGGSISIGHPFGATGGRMILQTVHGLIAAKKRYGLISVCAAGGLGTVMIIEANI